MAKVSADTHWITAAMLTAALVYSSNQTKLPVPRDEETIVKLWQQVGAALSDVTETSR